MKRMGFYLAALAALLSAAPVHADFIKQSTAYSRTVLMTSATDHVSGATGLTLTVKIAKAGGAYATITPTVTEQSGGTGKYNIALTSSNTDTLGALDMIVTASGADQSDTHDQVVAFDPGDGAALGLSAMPINMAQTLPTTPTAGTTGYALYWSAQQVGRIGTAQGGTSTTITLDAGASTIDGIYNGHPIKLTGNTGAGQFATISGYVGSTRVATISRSGPGGWTTTPDATTTFMISPVAQSTLLPGQSVNSSNFVAAPTAAQNRAEMDANSTQFAALVTGQGTINTGVSGINTKIGAPVGASLSADIAGVQATASATNTQTTAAQQQANMIAALVAQGYTVTRGSKLDNLDASVSSAKTSADNAGTTAGAINTKLGTPTGASVSADLVAIKSSSDATGTAVAALPSASANSAAVWNAGTRTLTAAPDSPGTTTLLARVPQAVLFDGNGYVRSADQTPVQVGSYGSGQDPATLTWNATASLFNTAGTMGQKANAAGSSGDPWTTNISTGYTGNQAGAILYNNLNATVGSRMAASSYLAPDNASVGAGLTILQKFLFDSSNFVKTAVQSLPNPAPTGYGSGSGGSVLVGGYTTGQDPASLILQNPGNKIVTTSAGGVKVGAYETGMSPAEQTLSAVLDGSITYKQAQALELAINTGKYSSSKNATTNVLTTTYYKQDGTTTIAVSTLTPTVAGTSPGVRTWTFSNLP